MFLQVLAERPHPVQQWLVGLSLPTRLLGGPHPATLRGTHQRPSRADACARRDLPSGKRGFDFGTYRTTCHLAAFIGEYSMRRKRGLLMQRHSQTKEGSRVTADCHAACSPTTTFGKKGRVPHLTIGSSKNRAVMTMNTIQSTIIVHAPMVMLSKVTPAHSQMASICVPLL